MSAGYNIGMIVTAASSNHDRELLGFIATAQRHTPSAWPIVVYNLGGLRPESLLELCRVQYRKLTNWTRFGPASGASPLDRRYLTNSAWKPLIILECLLLLPSDGILVYGDASTRFVAPIHAPLLAALSRTGVVSRETSGDVASYTHPSTFAAMGNDRTLEQYGGVPMACGCVSLWQPTARVLEAVAQPWARCALREECIRPRGADGFKVLGLHAGVQAVGYPTGHGCRAGHLGHCHRGDQSALSILLHDAFAASPAESAPPALRRPPAYLPSSDVLRVLRTERGKPSPTPPLRKPFCRVSTARAVTGAADAAHADATPDAATFTDGFSEYT